MRRRVFQSQRDFHNLPEDTIFDDWHIDCHGQGINEVTRAIELIKDDGNRAILTVNAEDAKGHKSSWHTTFTREKWEDFKNSLNDNGMRITDVWVTEETDGKGSLHNSRRACRIRSSYEEAITITPYADNAYDSDFDLGLSAAIEMYGDEFIQLPKAVLVEPHTLETLARYFDYEAYGRDFRIETGAEWDSERRLWTY